MQGVKIDPKKADFIAPYEGERIRAQIAWLNTQLQGKKWVLGTEELSLGDFNAAMPLWFGRNLGLQKTLDEFPTVNQWLDRFLSTIPKVKPSKMTAEEALEIAKNTPATSKESIDVLEPNGLKPGDLVTVTPVDSGRIPVSGKVVSSSVHHIALRRKDAETGIETVVHFPRSGFLVLPIKSNL
jgi:glutathione S-transferase